jgi:hypothetical protein
MVGSLSARVGLLAFALAIAAGIFAGNTATTVLTRSIAALLAGSLIGQISGYVITLVLRDHLQTRKVRIDRAHVAAIRSRAEAKAAEEAPQNSIG